MIISENLLQMSNVATGFSLVRKISSFGYTAVLAGGCVRDLVRYELGKDASVDVHDVDIATSMPMEELQKHFRCESNNGEAHGTILVFENGMPFEVTRYRSDGKYSDGRHPDSVEWSNTFTDDCRRRDFTMNAMGINKKGEVLDYFGGIDSINTGILTTVGDAIDRFSEDALRIIRAFRFAGKFDMAIDPATMAAAQALAGKLSCISMERIHDEFRKCAGYGIRPVARMMSFMANGIGWQVDKSVDWKNAAQMLTRIDEKCPGEWSADHIFPIIMPDEETMRRFKCTREEISAWKFIRGMYAGYTAGTLDVVDLVDGVIDSRWPVFRNYVYGMMGSFAISRGDEHDLKSRYATWPSTADMSKALMEAGEPTGKQFGERLRKIRLAVYKKKGKLQCIYPEDLHKLVASVRES